jgi:hypothetical protein
VGGCEARHSANDGLVRITTAVQDALPTPGPEMYIIWINKEGPSNTKVMSVQNVIMRNKGGSTPDDWGTSKDHRVASEKHEQRINCTNSNTVLMTSQGGTKR